jgi:WXG100 family type VII secretion target
MEEGTSMGVKVTYEQMQHAAKKLQTGKTDIESLLDQLKNQVDHLVSDGFVTDSASGQFQGSYEEFTKGARETIGGLDGMSEYLNNAVTHFQELDQNLAKGARH